MPNTASVSKILVRSDISAPHVYSHVFTFPWWYTEDGFAKKSKYVAGVVDKDLIDLC